MKHKTFKLDSVTMVRGLINSILSACKLQLSFYLDSREFY